MLGSMRRPAVRRASLIVALGVAALAGQAAMTPAHAWWRGGVFFDVPLVVPPIYYPPPVYYAPPPLYYPVPPNAYPAPYAPGSGYSPQASARAPGTTCYAGAYVCPLAEAFTPGSTCSCPDNAGRRVYGRAQ